MEKIKLIPGMLVEHPKRPQWGPGEIVKISGNSVYVRFQNDNSKDARQFSLSLVEFQKYTMQTDSMLDRVPIEDQSDDNVQSIDPEYGRPSPEKDQHETPSASKRTYNKYGEATFWDGEDESYEEPFKSWINYFACPEKLYSLKELEKQQPPQKKGVYGWYFDQLPPYVPGNGCVSVKKGAWPFRTDWQLLYIGKASDLKFRVYDMHFNNKYWMNKSMSSFRLTLGCLLSSEENLYLERHSDPLKDYTFGPKGDNKLSNWMSKHARVAWVETEDYVQLEKAVIFNYVLPLNTQDNEHPITECLSGLKSDFRDVAERDNPQKEHFKNVYQIFAEGCEKRGIKK